MPVVLNRVEKSRYLDSVALMRVSRGVSALPGVEAAALMIGSPSNKMLMREANLLAVEGERADIDDLVLAVRAKDEDAGVQALHAAQRLLSEREKAGDNGALLRAGSLAGALELLPQANFALISVSGEFAVREAKRALARGLHTLLFSDNISFEDEVALKREARARDLLLMGPDCGSALISGTPIAFANAVPRGDIGIVSASGTGLQEVSSLVARFGGGISHAIGVGGRDLDARVGALGTLAAIDALDTDHGTRAMLLISKPPAAEVAARVLERAGKCVKPFVVCFLGLRGAAMPKNAKFARNLTEAAELLLDTKIVWDEKPPLPGLQGRWVRGLFCGGTLCSEAEMVFRERGLRTGPGAHTFVDLGDDEHTRGRPHPMIEPELRNDPLREAFADPSVGAILVDVVLGYGSHPDPAGVLLKNVLHKPVIASVTGTEGDPQCYSRQVAALRKAGVIVAPSNAHAATLAAILVQANA